MNLLRNAHPGDSYLCLTADEPQFGLFCLYANHGGGKMRDIKIK